MIRVAIVDDDVTVRNKLTKHIKDYEKNNALKINITTFDDAAKIVENYKPIYDIIFMDIRMKEIDGVTATKIIREIDSKAIIIFITNMAGFAIKGYSVDALCYLLKPVVVTDFLKKLDQAVSRIIARKKEFIIVMAKSEIFRLDVSKISYLESIEHKVIIHMDDDDLVIYSSLQKLELQVKGHHFARCNSGYLVNLSYVERIEKDNVIVAGKSLIVSRHKKRTFINALTEYIGGEFYD